ncbi:hypothetical protein TSAR_013915 [Trichomalopsis sarcophagae]|uniref:Uncharacterized protein n=1 Tax=Trichomalopsis sarcophagae TaxID=543379 RepID=A0A232FKN1_9HYME|nr:hypothetical protein TSAR_013915 [Trichomalopsis sarcophagae]
MYVLGSYTPDRVWGIIKLRLVLTVVTVRRRSSTDEWSARLKLDNRLKTERSVLIGVVICQAVRRSRGGGRRGPPTATPLPVTRAEFPQKDKGLPLEGDVLSSNLIPEVAKQRPDVVSERPEG